ncbi:3-hydroxyacyl-CoA dehydrogenase [Paraburkholderia unamae]|uniref:3-hydroxyacyl-CoA dehydrogenase n=2 Tax=Paraburkholderia unamae TaxID=219649 RepID=A0ABX5KVH4_9BURK|nr:3-hydroxyacyl-CoA dehydrogenase [Paraburkholderia unamae]
MCEAEAQTAITRIVAANGISEIKGVSLVVEAVAERLDVKQKIFADVEEIVEDACILATNTSSISIPAIGAQMRRPERLIGMHFFNPAPVMALVEIVSGLATSRDIADCVYSTARDWGKVPVHTKSTPGFIVNRVARPYYAEGLRSLNEKVADAASIDALMRDSGQFRMGPLELMDLIGHDVNFAVTESVFSAMFAHRRFTPSIIQRELVDGGFLGRKTGRGFFDYSEGAQRPGPTIEPLASAPANVKLGPTLSPGTKLQERLVEAGLPVSPERTTDTDVIAEVAGGQSSEFASPGVSVFATQ